jgi:hypothetical protein
VDDKHKLIAADEVTNQVTDYQQLANVALAAKANLEIKQAEVVADAGYYNAAEVDRCVEAGITPMIPKADTSANSARGLYGKSRFRYDEKKDVYVCPAGAELTHRFNTYELGRELRYYRASGSRSIPSIPSRSRNIVKPSSPAAPRTTPKTRSIWLNCCSTITTNSKSGHPRTAARGRCNNWCFIAGRWWTNAPA